MAPETDSPAVEDAEPVAVRYEVGGKQIDPEKLPRMARRILEGQARKARKKYGSIRGPQGERPAIVLRMARLMDPRMEIVLEYPEGMKDSVKGHDKAVRIA